MSSDTSVDVEAHGPPVGGTVPAGMTAPSLIEAPTVRVEPPKRRIVRIAAVVLPPLVLVARPHRLLVLRQPRLDVGTAALPAAAARTRWCAVASSSGTTCTRLLDALWSSVRVAAIGLAISVVLGVALATLMSQSKLIERAMFPLMVALQAMPILALVPLIAILFGTNQTSRVIVCVLITFFPIVLNTLFGLVSADPGLHDLITLHHGGRVTRLRKVMFPSALPAMFAGLRISAGLSVIGAIVGDFFFGQGEKGLGQLIRQYAATPTTSPAMYAAAIVAATLGHRRVPVVRRAPARRHRQVVRLEVGRRPLSADEPFCVSVGMRCRRAHADTKPRPRPTVPPPTHEGDTVKKSTTSAIVLLAVGGGLVVPALGAASSPPPTHAGGHRADGH